MEQPIFTQKLGSGRWVGTQYVLDVCPVCSGAETMQFTGNGKLWGCAGCKRGGKDLASLVAYLKNVPMMESVIPSIVEPDAPQEVLVVSQYHSPFNQKVIGTGFGELDFLLGGLTEGALTVITGKRGEGKSTFLGQLALNAIDNRHNVCFYSGELSAGRFQAWLFSQAAGARHMMSYQDQFGASRYEVTDEADKKIREWLGDKIVLYDNTKAKSSERRTILRAFNRARSYYGSDLFIVDNLMTARYDIDDDQDALRAQANFAAEMLDFARENNVHVILVAHPRKGDSTDINDSVAGLGDITNMATNVIQVRKANDKEKLDCDAVVTISKNREHGDIGLSKFKFEKQAKRFVPVKGGCISTYGWEL